MLIAARNGFAMDGGLSAKSYIQDGLVAMWDGIENAGWGVHDSNATNYWVDLIGGRMFVGSCGRTPFSATFNGRQILVGKNADAINNADILTIETICYATNISGMNAYTSCYVFVPKSYDDSKNYRELWYGNNKMIFGGRNISGRCIQADKSVHHYAYNYIEEIGYRDGVKVQTYASPDYWNVRAPSIGGSVSHDNNQRRLLMNGGIYAIRIYNRSLTAKEIAHNYKIDKARFNLP